MLGRGSRLLALALTFAVPRSAWACGGGVVSTAISTGVAADTQRIFLSVRGGSAGSTDVITQIGVPATTADYGVILPVPAEPALDSEPVAASELEAFDRATAPDVVVNEDSAGGGCGCPFAGSDSAKAGDLGSGGVSVSEPVNIGPVTAVVLGGDTGAAINAWLTDNGFSLPAEGQALVDAYSGGGRYFVAIRRNEASAPGGPTSIGVHFTLPGDQRGLPLRFARIGAAEAVAFTIFLAAEGPAGPAAPFDTLTLDDLEADTLRASGYAAALGEAVLAHGAHAFVVEGVYPAADLISSSGASAPLQDLLDPTQTVTRLSTILPTTALDQDVGLYTAFSGDVPTTRYVRATPSRGANGMPFGASLAFAGVVFLRRKRPGRRG